MAAYPQETFLGTVVNASGDQISVGAGPQKLTLSTDAHTRIWKDKTMESGDRVIVKYHVDTPGKLLADEIWVNLENHYAVITRVNGTSFDVFTNPNADPQSSYKQENRTVRVDANTVFEASAREDLKSGRGVQVIGVRGGNGEILAARLIVYEGNRPVRMGKDAHITLPNGTIR